MRQGRPLRFMAGALVCWTGVRVMMLWPAAAPIGIVDAAPAIAGAPASDAEARPGRVVEQDLPPVRPWPGRLTVSAPSMSARAASAKAEAPAVAVGPAGKAGSGQRPVLASPSIAVPPQSPAAIAVRLQPLPAPTSTAARPRLAGDVWLVARPGGGTSLAVGQLGASQAGARATYALDRDRRLALSGRISAPLHDSGREAALGIDVQPSPLPVHLLVEERVPLDGGGVRPAVELFGGVSAALPGSVRLDAYAQGGAVWKRGVFADAAALAIHPLLSRGGVRLEAGGGVWGAAQRHVARLDLGPAVALVVPAGKVALRLGVDYRQRVAGRARPGSGPALTLGGSF